MSNINTERAEQYRDVAKELLKYFIRDEILIIYEWGDSFKEAKADLKQKVSYYLEQLDMQDSEEYVFEKIDKEFSGVDDIES